MTVKQLIEKLREQAQDAEVEVQVDGISYAITDIDGNSVSTWIVASE